MGHHHPNNVARAIDHLVLPVRDLARARARLTALGFTVAPDGVHPFGTANCCVYLADGTFLEPLGLMDDRAAREASLRGNAFILRDAAFRFRCGDEGGSAIAFATDDAIADHVAFVDMGLSSGSMLEFSRPFVDAAGKSDTATFRLAFMQDFRAPDVFCFTCQRPNAPTVDRSTLEAHANGVTGISGIVLSAPQATAYTDFALTAANAEMTAAVGRDSTMVRARNASIHLHEPPAMQREFGTATSNEPGLRFSAVVFKVSDLSALATLFKLGKLPYQMRGRTVVVHPAPGQGVIFAFEESR